MSNSNPQQQPPASQPSQPSLIGGHAEYIKGTAESTIGTITGSQAWTASGEQDKAHAKASMRAVAEKRDATASGYGQVEEVAGKITGCEGMKQEGAASKRP